MQRGIETIVVLPKGDDEFPRALKKQGIKYYAPALKRPRNTRNPIPNLVWICCFVPNLLRVASIIRNERVDIVHGNTMAYILGPLAGWLTGRKVIWHLNDINTPRLILKALKPLIVRVADSVVFASEAVRREFGKVPRSIKGGILYAPVDTRRFKPLGEKATFDALRRELGIPVDSRVIGMVGHINEVKGVPDFINAAAHVRTFRPDCRFIVVGAPLTTKKDLFDHVKSLIKSKRLDGHVILTGKRNDVYDMLGLFDVFVMPSLYEACPIALLEAMAMAKPIVATDVGGIPELVRNGVEGLLSPPKDPCALAERILFLLDHPLERERLALAARERASEKFDLSKCIEWHERYYRELTERDT